MEPVDIGRDRIGPQLMSMPLPVRTVFSRLSQVALDLVVSFMMVNGSRV